MTNDSGQPRIVVLICADAEWGRRLSDGRDRPRHSQYRIWIHVVGPGRVDGDHVVPATAMRAKNLCAGLKARRAVHHVKVFADARDRAGQHVTSCLRSLALPSLCWFYTAGSTRVRKTARVGTSHEHNSIRLLLQRHDTLKLIRSDQATIKSFPPHEYVCAR